MKKTLAFLFLSSLLFRLWFAIGYWGNKPLTHDAREYLELAQSYKETGHLVYLPKHTFQIESYGRAPGYPIWLSLLLRIGPSLAWLRLCEVIVSMIGVYILFLIARDHFPLRVSLIVLIGALFYVPWIWLIPGLLSENLWMVLILLSYRFLLKQTPVNHVAAFGTLALATLVRPAAVFLVPFFCYWIYRKNNLRQGILLTLFYFLLLFPWNLQVYLREGKWSFIASEGGVTFWTGTHLRYWGEGDLAVNPPVQADYRKLLQEHPDKSPAERQEIYFRQGIQNILQHPVCYGWIEIKKLFLWFFPVGPSVWQTSWLHRVTAITFYIPLLFFALSGFRLLPVDLRHFFAGIILSFTFMILIFFPQERFRIASLDPIFLLIASLRLSRLKYPSPEKK